MRQIIIDVSQDGEIRLETRGFRGKSCIEESEFIKELLGHEQSRQLTPAYYKKAKQIIKKYLHLCG